MSWWPPRSPPSPPLERVTTRPLPDDVEPCELVRVVTRPPEDPEPLPDDPTECDALVRVVTGALGEPEPATGDPTECDALVRVVTEAVPPATVPAEPTARDPLAWVRTELAGATPTPPPLPPMALGPPWRPVPCPER